MVRWVKRQIRCIGQKIYSLFKFKHKHIRIAWSAMFNPQTVFGGYNNIHNNCWISDSIIGRYSYMGNDVVLPNSKIGNFCSIGSNVKVVTATHPSHTFVSTSPVFFSTLGQCNDIIVSTNKYKEQLSIDGKNVIIGNDVWIGDNVILKGGIRINDGAIVAMGSVVTKDVPPFAIVGGVPAKVIKYRFTPEEIAAVQESEWWDKERGWLIKHIDLFENIEDFAKANITNR